MSSIALSIPVSVLLWQSYRLMASRPLLVSQLSVVLARFLLNFLLTPCGIEVYDCAQRVVVTPWNVEVWLKLVDNLQFVCVAQVITSFRFEPLPQVTA